MECVPTLNPNSQVRHSRMLLAGIQAGSELDPRLGHSGGDGFGSRSSSPQPQFSKENTKVTEDSKNYFFLRALRELRGEIIRF